MNRTETVQVITLMAGNYDSIANKTQQQREMMVNTWYQLLGDLDYKLVLSAVQQTMIESPYTPTIHDIRKRVVENINPITDNRLEEWDECYKLICRGSVVTQEEFDSHSETVKKFLGSVTQLKDYAKGDIETLNTVVKSSFLKQYDILKQRERESKLIPERMKKLTQQLVENISIKQLTD